MEGAMHTHFITAWAEKKGPGKKGLKTSKNDHLPKWLEIMKI